jgi:hypothetical protein
MMLGGDLKCMFPFGCGNFSDPVVVMVLSLGFIASVFLLQYDTLCLSLI